MPCITGLTPLHLPVPPRRGALFGCLKQRLPALNYSAQLSAWLDTFPAEQVLLLQVRLLAPPAGVCRLQMCSLHVRLMLVYLARWDGASALDSIWLHVAAFAVDIYHSPPQARTSPCLAHRLSDLHALQACAAPGASFPPHNLPLVAPIQMQYETLASPDQERVAGQLASLHK